MSKLILPPGYDREPVKYTVRRAAPGRQARYDAAQTDSENRRHWANVDGLSARAANSVYVRQLLRNRSRYEIANNSYARGIVRTLANDCIGVGPRLQMCTPNRKANKQIESLFRKWSRAVGLAAKLRTMRMSKAGDGEAFALFTNNPRLPTPVQLDLRLIEAEQVTTFALPTNDPLRVDGIQFDDHGNPIIYDVLRRHPGDVIGPNPWQWMEIPAEEMVHWFAAERPGQARGIPEITAALPLFAQLRRYTLAVLGAAETAADFAGVLYTEAPADEAQAGVPFEEIELVKRMLLTLPAGNRMEQVDAKQPTTTYPEFKHEILLEIARCPGIPRNIVFGDSSNYNYASGQLDNQLYDEHTKIDRSDVELIILAPIFAKWLEEATLVPGLLPGGLGPYGDWEYRWYWPARKHADPTKVAAAREIDLRTGVGSRRSMLAADGIDIDEHDEASATDYGITVQEYRRMLLIKTLAVQGQAPENPPAGDSAATGSDEPVYEEADTE